MRYGNSGFLNVANAPPGFLGLGQAGDIVGGISSLVSSILGSKAAKQQASATKAAAEDALRAARVQAEAIKSAALSQERAGAWKSELVKYVPLVGGGLLLLGIGSYVVYRMRRRK